MLRLSELLAVHNLCQSIGERDPSDCFGNAHTVFARHACEEERYRPSIGFEVLNSFETRRKQVLEEIFADLETYLTSRGYRRE